MASRHHGLGRGLGALLPSTPRPTRPPSDGRRGSQRSRSRTSRPNPKQPRKDFDIKALNDLAASLKKSGVLQPVVVRKVGPGYQLIVGERRWRAAKLAGLERIPAVVRDVTDVESLELALVENLLREDLNPIEEAEAYQRLLAEFGWTQEELAERVEQGSEHASPTALRLLKLPDLIRADLRAGRLTMGHARALLSLTSEARAASPAGRDPGALVVGARHRGRRAEEAQPASPRRPRAASPELTALEDSFRETLATRVRLVGNERARAHRDRLHLARGARPPHRDPGHEALAGTMRAMAERLIVGMSGGVDSSVAAALLVEQGYRRRWASRCASGPGASRRRRPSASAPAARRRRWTTARDGGAAARHPVLPPQHEREFDARGHRASSRASTRRAARRCRAWRATAR